MRVLFTAISMIYRGSNVELDEFKKTFYVPRRIDVFGHNTKPRRSMELVETTNSTPRVLLLMTDGKAKPPDRSGGFISVATPLLAEQRDGLRILRLRDRRQISVNVLEIAVRQDLLAVGRHGDVTGADKRREALVRQRIGRQHLAVAGCDRALPLEPVALPAAVFHECGFALGHIARRERRAMTENHAGHHSGQRDTKHWVTHVVHFPRVSAAASRRSRAPAGRLSPPPLPA